MMSLLRKIIPERSPLRLLYHKISAILAAIWYRFPGHYLTVIAVTGTSGKSTTVELIWHILQHAGEKCGSLSSIQFHVGNKTFDNESLRTSLRPWKTQRWLRKMVKAKCKYVVIEVSSHAIDQNRLWGTGIDTAVLTNIYENEHLDYHGDFSHYLKTKFLLFQTLNREYRKPNVPKCFVLNRDDKHYEVFADASSDRAWTYSYQQNSDFRAQDIQLNDKGLSFNLRIPNNNAHIEVPLIGQHNLENILAAITATSIQQIPLPKIEASLKSLKAIPSRLELVDSNNPYSVFIDYSYKPSALQSVLKTLKDVGQGRIIVVWGGAGGRSKENWQECGEWLDKLADEIVLTTDDPYNEDPRYIVQCVQEKIKRKEGENFFTIADRYEAIRYALLTAQPKDIILIAGRGHEKIQTIGKIKIPFVDREVVEEILQTT